MSYQVYKTNSADWHLIAIDEAGLKAAKEAHGSQFGPFRFWKTIKSLGGVGMDKEETVTHNLEAKGYHMQNSKIQLTEQPG